MTQPLNHYQLTAFAFHILHHAVDIKEYSYINCAIWDDNYEIGGYTKCFNDQIDDKSHVSASTDEGTDDEENSNKYAFETKCGHLNAIIWL